MCYCIQSANNENYNKIKHEGDTESVQMPPAQGSLNNQDSWKWA